MTRPAARVLFALLALAALPARAQGLEGSAGPVYVCDLPTTPHAHDDLEGNIEDGLGGGAVAFSHAAAACAPDARTARFDVEFVGFPAEARAAFEAALDVWACRIVSGQTIRVRARWEAIDAQTLGRAGPFLFRGVPGAPDRDVWLPAALADVYAGRDLGPGQPDIEATFNSALTSWHLDPGAPAPPGRYDLATAVLHELAHGLGFIGALAVEDGLGYVGAPGRTRGAYVFDRFAVDPAGRSLLDASRYPDASAALATALQSPVAFDGPAVRQATGGPVPLFTPRPWAEGASYSHLAEGAFAAGTPDALMTPALARAETVRAPGPAVCGVLADLGWALAGECAALVGERPGAGGRTLAVRPAGPNPLRARPGARIAVAVRAAEAQAVRVVLVDALGRTVAVLLDRRLASGETVDAAADATALASGVYRVVVRGEGADAAPVALPVTVVR